MSRSLAPKHVGRKEITCAPSFKPPPSSRCDLCGGELRLKKIELADRELDLEDEMLVCVNCGHELSCTVPHNHTAPQRAKVA